MPFKVGASIPLTYGIWPSSDSDVQPQLLNLPRDRVPPDAELLRGFDAAAAGDVEGGQDELRRIRGQVSNLNPLP